MNLKPGDKVRVKRDIHRWDGEPRDKHGRGEKMLYAAAGTEGVLEECFKQAHSKLGHDVRWHVKVRVGEHLLTFRIQSVEKIY